MCFLDLDYKELEQICDSVEWAFCITPMPFPLAFFLAFSYGFRLVVSRQMGVDFT